MASNMIVTKCVNRERPVPADERLARVAAGIVVAARAGDDRGLELLLAGLEPFRLVRLFKILGAAADQDVVLHAAGFGGLSQLRPMVRQYANLRKQGVPLDDVPPHLVQANRMYWRMWHRVKQQRDAAAGGTIRREATRAS